MVDFTCTRTKCPSCSTATSWRAVSPDGLVTHNPCSAARVIKRSSAHSPRSLGCLILIPLVFMKFLSPTFFGGHSRPPDFFLTPIKTRPFPAAPISPIPPDDDIQLKPQVQNSPFSHFGNFAWLLDVGFRQPPTFTHHRCKPLPDVILTLSRAKGKGSMHSHRYYYVYIMTNRSRTLYTGITGNLSKRVFQHKTGVFPGVTARYRIDRLVYYNRFIGVGTAIQREKPTNGLTPFN